MRQMIVKTRPCVMKAVMKYNELNKEERLRKLREKYHQNKEKKKQYYLENKQRIKENNTTENSILRSVRKLFMETSPYIYK